MKRLVPNPFGVAFLLACLPLLASQAATVAVGGLAIIGYNDNNNGDVDGIDNDSFAVLATEDIVAGTTVYFTNNAWSNASQSFVGAGGSSLQGDGFEQMMKLTVTGTISAGTVFSSLSTSGNYSWDTSSAIPSGGGSTFSHLQLKVPASPSFLSDEIYIFQSSTTNPLFTPENFIYLLNFGDITDPGFNEPQFQYDVGAIPDGYISHDGGVNPYALINTLSSTGDPMDPMANDNTAVGLDPNSNFHDGWFGINLSSGPGLALMASGGTKAEWLSFINDSGNWEQRGTDTLPSGPLNFSGAPEPSRSLLALTGLLGLALRRQRRRL